MALDLGTFLLGGLQTLLPTAQPANNPFIPDFIEGFFDQSPTQVLPTVAAQSGVSMACGTGHPKRVLGYLDSQGNFCKKKSRRRRNRLATTSDIKDLAALKSVLGGGKAFETWIAVHN